MQLTSTDTILYADIFHYITQRIDKKSALSLLDLLKQYYQNAIDASENQIPSLLDAIPDQWNISTEKVTKTLQQLFKTSWLEDTWINFTAELKDNLQYNE